MVISQELVDAILEMKKEGYTKSEIIQAMSSQGYTPAEIEEHLARAERISDESLYKAPPVSPPPTPSIPITEPSTPEIDEELIESIVEDKIRALKGSDEWKETLKSRIDKLEQSVQDLKIRVDSLNKALLGKLETSNECMRDVSREMKAIQKVMKENIPELTKAISGVKLKKKKKKKK